MKAYDDLSKSENKKLVKNINYGVSQSNIDENKKAAEIRKNNDERRYSAKDGMLKVKQQGMAGSYPGDFQILRSLKFNFTHSINVQFHIILHHNS